MSEEPSEPSTGAPRQERGLFARLLALLRGGRRRPTPPSSIGRYRVIRAIGEGGMGKVFEAQDELLGRRVAIKRLKAPDASGRRRFLREARAAARLSHPNVCALFEIGEDASGLFLAMELLSGEPLSARLRRASMEASEVIPLGGGILAALQTIHSAGLVHRDLKPSNVFLTPHGPRLLDFGLVTAAARGSSPTLGTAAETPSPIVSQSALTGVQSIVGTPGYMAPEQIMGDPVDGRADLFAMGALLYEALAGRRAFPGIRPVDALSATIHDTPPPLEGPLARIDPVVRRALAKKPSERYATAQEMAEALHAAGTAAPAAAPGAEAAAAGDVFAGRRAELARLDEHVAAAIAGSGRAVFITGERGAGKTALAGEILRRVRSGPTPVTVVAGRCIEHQGPGETFQPFLDAFGRFFASRARPVAVDLVRTWAPTVGVLMQPAHVPDPDGSLHRQATGATRERLIRESGDFMEAAARLYPVVMLLEDLQWADAASVDLISHLARRAPRQRILFLYTCRPSEVEAANPSLHRCMLDLRAAGNAHELALGPLGVADVEQWLEARFPDNDFAASLAPLLHARAEGLPLFVRGLVELLAGRRDIQPGPQGFRLARPAAALDLEPSKDLKDLVRAHLATLPSAEHELLAAASVLGKEFSSAIARQLTGGDELALEERLQRLARVNRVLDSQGDEELPDGTLGTRYRFAHGLYQRVLYEDLVAPRRGELHGRAGELMLRHWGENASTRAAELAEHFERGRDLARATRFRTLAGENAGRRFSGAEAVEHYNAALALAAKLPKSDAQPLEVALLGRRAGARQLQARFDEAARDYEAMAARAREARLAGAECEALSRLCTAHFYERRLPQLAARAQQALATAERQGTPHHLAEARARTMLLMLVQGRLDEAGRTGDAVIAAAPDAGSTGALQIGLSLRGFVHYWQGEYHAAEVRLADALLLCEERGDGFEAFMVRMFGAMARVQLGRLSEALIDFEHTIVLAKRNADRFWEPRLVSDIGWIHRELGDVKTALQYDQRALELARENPAPWSPSAEPLLNVCIDNVRSGDLEAAAELLASLESGFRGVAWMRWMNDLRFEAVAVEYYATRRDFEPATRHIARLNALADKVGARNYACAAARFAAQIALAQGAVQPKLASRLEKALGGFKAFPAPLESWKSWRVLALQRRALGNEAAARAAFSNAAADVQLIASGVDDAALRAGFLANAAVDEVLRESGRA